MSLRDGWPDERLSREASARREELLGQLKPVVRGRPRRRVAAKAMAAAVLLCGLGVAIVGGLPAAPATVRVAETPAQVHHTPQVQRRVEKPRVAVAASAGMTADTAAAVMYVQTDPSISRSLAVRTTSTEMIGDAELLAALHAAGQAQPGLVRVAGRVVVAGNFQAGVASEGDGAGRPF